MNQQLITLVKRWQADGSPKQEGFDWTSNRHNWEKAFASDNDFISRLPSEIDRAAVRTICESSKYSIREKFLTVMVWGYGDRGYGPFRVSQMMSQDHLEPVLTQAYEISKNGDPKSAYDFLRKNRIRMLGPSYGSKFLSFCTPKEVGAPIYDSLIARWITEFAKEDFQGIATSSRNWNSKTYSSYWDWVAKYSKNLSCHPDDIELVLFRDAEQRFSKASNWSGK